MKKLLSIILAVIMIISVLPITAFADTQMVEHSQILRPKYRNSSYIAMSDLEQLLNVDAFKADMINEFKAAQTEIDISKYNIQYNDANINAIGDLMFYNFPEAFHIAGLRFQGISGIITKILISSDIVATEYASMYNQMVAAGDTLLEGIEGNANLNEVEKALALHDRLVLWNDYVNNGWVSHSGYGALVNRQSVCDGYTNAYTYLLNRVGIKSEYISSDLLNHAWNIVYINDTPYHVDVTWDDGYSSPVMISHKNFLRSTDGIISTEHHDSGYIDYPAFAKDTAYDNYFWQNINSVFCLAENDLYYIDQDAEYIKKYDNGQTYNIHSVDATWPSPNGNYVDNFSYLGSNGSVLFYSSPTQIYSYNPSLNIAKPVYTPSAVSSGKYIWEFEYKDGYLVCYMAYDWYDEYAAEKYLLKNHICEFADIPKTNESCTQNGEKAHQKCESCGKILLNGIEVTAADIIIPAAHTLNYVPEKPYTCTQSGYKAYEHCTICSYTTYQETPAAHTLIYVAYKAPTITAAGHNAYEYCTKCSYTTYQEIPKLQYLVGWNNDSRGWWFVDKNGDYIIGWAQIDGRWYYFDNSGWMQTGWEQIKGKWYYFNTSGAMLSGWQQIGGKWYYFNTDGDMVTGWKLLGGKWYYFNTDGDMVTGWKLLSGKWYYFNTDGDMVIGWKQLGSKWYYFNKNGDMATGWAMLGGQWYYFNTNGDMAIGWLKLGNTWYYLGDDGVMYTGIRVIGGKKYTFNSVGVCLNPYI